MYIFVLPRRLFFHLFVHLLATKNTEPISMKFYGGVGHDPRKNPSNFKAGAPRDLFLATLAIRFGRGVHSLGVLLITSAKDMMFSSAFVHLFVCYYTIQHRFPWNWVEAQEWVREERIKLWCRSGGGFRNLFSITLHAGAAIFHTEPQMRSVWC